MEKGKRMRAEKFSDEELNILLIFLSSYPDLVTGQFGKNITNLQEQTEAWRNCSELINANSFGVMRTWEQVKKKWNSLKSKTKAKATDLKFKLNKTGTGTLKPTEKLTDIEEKVMALIGHTCAEGIVSREKGDSTYRQIHDEELQQKESEVADSEMSKEPNSGQEATINAGPSMAGPSMQEQDLSSNSAEICELQEISQIQTSTPNSSWQFGKRSHDISERSKRRKKQRTQDGLSKEDKTMEENVIQTQTDLLATLKDNNNVLNEIKDILVITNGNICNLSNNITTLLELIASKEGIVIQENAE